MFLIRLLDGAQGGIAEDRGINTPRYVCSIQGPNRIGSTIGNLSVNAGNFSLPATLRPSLCTCIKQVSNRAILAVFADTSAILTASLHKRIRLYASQLNLSHTRSMGRNVFLHVGLSSAACSSYPSHTNLMASMNHHVGQECYAVLERPTAVRYCA